MIGPILENKEISHNPNNSENEQIIRACYEND